MSLIGSVKMTDIGRQYLKICNRKCQLHDYISY